MNDYENKKNLIDESNVALSTINPSDPDLFFHDNYNDKFSILREKDPIHYCTTSEFGPFWSITRHADIIDIEKKPEIFSSANGFSIIDLPMVSGARSFLSMDPPKHRIIRQSVTPMVSLENLNKLSEFVAVLVSETLDNLPLNTPIDWVKTVSVEITIKVLAYMMGAPLEDSKKLVEWADIAATMPSSSAEIKSIENYYAALNECKKYFENLCEKYSRESPQNNFVSLLVHFSQEQNMGGEELFLNLLLLLLAGNDTTRHSITGGALFFDNNPIQRELFYNEESVFDSGISEIVRFQTPVAHMRRTATQDLMYRGKKIRKNDKIVLWYISANRDASVFQNADQFIVNRDKHDLHLAFGAGVHKCIGKNIALLQLKTLWREIIKRRLVIKKIAEPVRLRSNMAHGYSSFLVEIKKST